MSDKSPGELVAEMKDESERIQRLRGLLGTPELPAREVLAKAEAVINEVGPQWGSGKAALEEKWNVKVPKWDRTEERSTTQVGPWTATCELDPPDEDDDRFWSVHLKGPFVEEYFEHWDKEWHSTRGQAEYDAMSSISNVASLLEPLQRYL